MVLNVISSENHPLTPDAEAMKLAQDLGRLQTRYDSVQESFKRAIGLCKTSQAVDSEISVKKDRLKELTAKPLSDETLDAIYGVLASAEIPKDQWIKNVRSRQEHFAKTPDLTEQIAVMSKSGSRGEGTSGYFKAQTAEGLPVVLFRGWYGTQELASVMSFLDEITENNPELRKMLPQLHGRAEINGLNYLVLEDLKANGVLVAHQPAALSRERFLEECGHFFQPKFREAIEKWGLNIGRTTLEQDYLFVQNDGRIRMGIPFRALPFVMDARNKMFVQGAVSQPEGAERPSAAEIKQTHLRA